MARLCEAEINLRQSLSHQRYRVNRALIVWLAVERSLWIHAENCFCRQLKTTPGCPCRALSRLGLAG